MVQARPCLCGTSEGEHRFGPHAAACEANARAIARAACHGMQRPWNSRLRLINTIVMLNELILLGNVLSATLWWTAPVYTSSHVWQRPACLWLTLSIKDDSNFRLVLSSMEVLCRVRACHSTALPLFVFVTRQLPLRLLWYTLLSFIRDGEVSSIMTSYNKL